MYEILNQENPDEISNLRADILLNLTENKFSYDDWFFERLRRKKSSSDLWRGYKGGKDYLIKTKYRRLEKTLMEYKGLKEAGKIFDKYDRVSVPDPVGIINFSYKHPSPDITNFGCIQTIIMSWYEGVNLGAYISSRKYRKNILEALSDAYIAMIENQFLWKDPRIDHILMDQKGDICFFYIFFFR
jgi:hypothetical protein